MDINYQRTLSDIDLILNELDEETKNQIPNKLQKFIKENKLQNYISEIDINIPLENQRLTEDTKAFLAMLYLNYWCTTNEEKEKFQKQLNENEKEYQKELAEKYSIDNIFNKNKEKVEKTTEEIESKETGIIQYKENIIKKILNKIFSFFRRK